MARKLSRPTQGERERLNRKRRYSASFGIKLGRIIGSLPDEKLKRFTRAIRNRTITTRKS